MSDASAQNIDAGARELVAQARRLGLTWGLRPATVLDQSHARYDGDGDEVATRVINLLEMPLFVDQRVMCVFVPPSGNFVLGSLTDTKVLFRARRAAAQLIDNASEEEIEWDAVDVDTHGGFTTSFPTDWVASIPGWYQLSGGVGFAAGGTGLGRRGTTWRRNHVALDGSNIFVVAGSTSVHSIPGRTTVVSLEVGDSVQMTAFQDQGVGLNTATGSSSPSVDITYLRPPITVS